MLCAFAFILQAESSTVSPGCTTRRNSFMATKYLEVFVLEDAIKKLPIVLLVKKMEVVLAGVPSILIPFIHLF